MSAITETEEQSTSLADESLATESEPSNADTGQQNGADQPSGTAAAIARCILAKRRARTLAASESSYRAMRAGAEGYLGAMPRLSDLDSIRDFVACVTYGVATRVIRRKDSLPLLEAAKAALAMRRQRSAR